METMQPYYRLMKSILFVLFLSFGMISCEKEDPVSTSPTTRQTDDSTTDPTDPDPTDPVVRSNNEQTVFMYLPWSNNLTSFFYQNIADLKSIIGNNILKNERVIVFICTSATKATLSELVYENGKGVQKTLKTTIIRILPIQLQRASLLFWTMYKPMLPPNDMQWLSDATEWDGYLYREQFHAAACRLVKSTGSMNMHWWHVFWRNTNEISNWYYYACRRYFERGPKDGIYTFRWLLYVYGRGCLWP